MKLSSKILLLSAFLLLPVTSQAWVKSISVEKKLVGENVSLLEVSVKCNIHKAERKLRKNVLEKSAWCSVDLPNVCSSWKVKAARKICQINQKEYEELIANTGAGVKPAALNTQSSNETTIEKNTDTKQELMEEKILIEERRIKIAELQLELKRKELALKKQISSN